MASLRFHSPRRSSRESSPDPDAELLLPSPTGKRYKNIQRAKRSFFYILIASAAAFILVIMIWLGPGSFPHDLKGIATQVQAPVGYKDLLQDQDAPTSSHQASSTHPQAPVQPSPSEHSKPSAPMPHHAWNPLLNDPAPITHVTVKPCMFPPWVFVTLCAPPQTARDIALYGEWVRVPRDLSKGVGHYYTEIYYRRAQTLDVAQLGVPPVTALRIWSDDEALKPQVKAEIERDGWEPAGGNMRTGIWPAKATPARLWLTRSTKIAGAQHLKPINEINVLWGEPSELKPWWGFERIGGDPVFASENPMNHVRCDIVVRREIPTMPSKPELFFAPDGKFKILQISDLHFSVKREPCQSASLLPSCEKVGSDAATAAWLSRTIDSEKPDLVVLTGDQLRGLGQTFDALSSVIKIGHLFADKRVPWTVVFGNHDHDQSLAIEEQMYVMKQMPYFLGEAGPGVTGFSEEHNAASDEDMGVGNYVLPVRAGKGDGAQALTLYFLDSHSIPSMTISQIWKLALGGSISTDALKDSQMAWYRNQSAQQPQLERPYRPASNPSTTVNTGASHALKKPTALMFFHIPLPEAYATADKNVTNGAELLFGNQREGPLASKSDRGFFKNAIIPSTDGTSEPEVKAVFNGHAHLTDTCRRHRGVWHCMSGLSSYSGRAQDTWERRVRVIEVEEWGERIVTFGIRDDRALSVKSKETPRQSGHLVLYDTTIAHV